MQKYIKDFIKNDQKFADDSVQYPDDIEFSKNIDIRPEWFLKSTNSNISSELQTVIQYTTQHVYYPNVTDILLGISATEMRHYKHLTELIVEKLGGSLMPTEYKGVGVKIGDNWQDAVRINIEGEHLAIKEYNNVLRSLQFCNNSKEKQFCIELINKLIADEKLHLQILENLIRNGKIHKT